MGESRRRVLGPLSLLLCTLQWFVAFSAGAAINQRGPDEELAATALANVYKILEGTLSDGSDHSSCTKENVAVRKEYGDMSKSERLDYIRAVHCLLNSPSKLEPGLYPGAKTRYDDFVVVHMNLTYSVHGTANFMHWHRWYIWAYEYALRNECGYTGYQPYWNWGKYPDPSISPIFNGDDYSMGGNGEPLPHSGRKIGPGPYAPAGKGGGCVKTGPFANTTVNLGPKSLLFDPVFNITPNPQADGYGYNPRCLRRDVGDFFTTNYLRPIDIVNHIQSTDDIDIFQTTLQVDTAERYALHSGGHFSIWGDPGGDVFVSPAEPTFWFHHTQLDRHWWTWQNLDPAARVQQYKGGTVWLAEVSPPGHIDDPQELSIVTPGNLGAIASKYLVSSTAGPLCYVYV